MKENFIIHRLAIAKCILFSMVTLGMSWQMATQSVDFATMHWGERLGVFVGMFVLWGNQMLNFLDKTAANINAGRPLVGGTEFLSKQKENG